MSVQTLPAPVADSETKLAPLYRVLIHNDVVTTMGFVIRVLTEIFHLELRRARDVMMEAHESGVALVVVEPLEAAQCHVDQARSLARPRHYPLAFTIEPEDAPRL
jgi:ATP-dependent Clp protease adaptor protein ClpS